MELSKFIDDIIEDHQNDFFGHKIYFEYINHHGKLKNNKFNRLFSCYEGDERKLIYGVTSIYEREFVVGIQEKTSNHKYPIFYVSQNGIRNGRLCSKMFKRVRRRIKSIFTNLLNSITEPFSVSGVYSLEPNISQVFKIEINGIESIVSDLNIIAKRGNPFTFKSLESKYDTQITTSTFEVFVNPIQLKKIMNIL